MKRLALLLVTLAWGAQPSAAATGGLYDGLIEPHDVVEVSSQAPGILAQVSVRRGEAVKEGQVLAHLEADLDRIVVELATAQVAFAQRRVARNEELFRKDLVSEHEMDEMRTEIEIAQLQLQQASQRLDMKTIRSPVDGIVTERALSPGEYVGEGAILTVAQVDPLNVEVIVPIEQYLSIRVGSSATVMPQEPVGGSYTAVVVIVDQVIDAASGTFGVRLELPNPGQRLPAGVKCQVQFEPVSQ